MTIHASVRGSVVTAVVEEFARHGGDPRWVLERHGLTPALLADPFSSVSLGRYVAMFEDMAMRLDDPLLGARLGQAMRAVDLGPAGMLVARSRSVMVALERLTRFVSSFQPGTQAGLKQCDDLLVWTYRLNDAAIWPRRQDAEFTLASTLRLIRSAFAPDWQPLMVQFEHAPASPNSARALEKLLGCPVRFEAATNGMVLPAEEAHTRFRDEDKDLIAVLERFLVTSAPMATTQAKWSDKVLSLIAAYLGQQTVTLERLAADLAVAPRSLQRRLADEGTSLRQLLRDHRQELTVQHLQAGAPRLGNLAEALGYADGTTFWRAHRNWTGQTPSTARAMHQSHRMAPDGPG
jgi:AraC-like DNA-binding protein